MNSNGGSLSINVNDLFTNCGADPQSLPGAQNLVRQKIIALVNQSVGSEYGRLINIRFESVADKLTAIVEVAKSPQPIWAKQ
jgi:hypothetical protein